jgi:hypothetical protein
VQGPLDPFWLAPQLSALASTRFASSTSSSRKRRLSPVERSTGPDAKLQGMRALVMPLNEGSSAAIASRADYPRFENDT